MIKNIFRRAREALLFLEKFDDLSCTIKWELFQGLKTGPQWNNNEGTVHKSDKLSPITLKEEQWPEQVLWGEGDIAKKQSVAPR